MTDKNIIIPSEESRDTYNMTIRAQIASDSESHTNPSGETQNPVVERSNVQEQERTEDSGKVPSFKKKRLPGSMWRKLKKAQGILIQPEDIGKLEGENLQSIMQQQLVGERVSHSIESIKQKIIGGGTMAESHVNPSVGTQNPVVDTSMVQGQKRKKDLVEVPSVKKKKLTRNLRRKLKRAKGILIQPENQKSIKQQPAGRGISHSVSIRRRVAIVPHNYPQIVLRREQCDEITGYITNCIDTLDPDGVVHPRFDSMSQKNGGCVIKCLDDTTRAWVEKEVSGLELTCGIKLRTISVSSLRKKTVKAGALFPGRVRRNIELLMILRVQNPDINFKNWKIREKKEEEGGFFTMFELPEAGSRTLGSGGRLICYGLRRVNMRLFENDNYRLPPLGYHFGSPRNIVKRDCNINCI